MKTNPHNWLWHPDGYVVYRRYSQEDAAFVYSFQPTVVGGYFNWHSLVKQKGLRPDDFRNY